MDLSSFIVIGIGSAADLLQRIKKILPPRWWAWGATYRDAVLGGICDAAAWSYSWIPYAALQTRLATATGVWLDIYAYDFVGRFILRGGTSDSAFRSLLQSTILQQRVTRFGVQQIVTNLLGNVSPRIIEPWSPGDCGGYGCGNIAYGRAGAWGSIQLPGQVFMQLSRAGVGATGVPTVTGYGNTTGGYGVGAIEYGGVEIAEIGITDQQVYAAIEYSKPTGITAWVQF
jgi:hypothetical protein